MQLPVFKLEKYFDRYEFKTPYNLCASDNESMSLKELLSLADDDAKSLWDDMQLGYTHVSGHPLLKREIVKLYKNMSDKNIGTFAGAEEAIFVLMNVLLKAGDHVIVPSPCYQSLKTIPKEIGADVTLLPLKERGGGWIFDVDELAKAVKPNTKLIVINFPHNPTGVHIDKFTLDEIIEIAKKAGAYLLSDEVYRFSEHRPGSSLPPAADLYDNAISAGVLSKTLGLAGLRIGWLATQDTELLEACLDYKCYLSLCNSASSEILALIALRAKDHIIEKNLNIIRRNLGLLDQFFEKFQKIFAWKRPTAGSVAFPKLLASMPIEEFAEELITREGVLILPGSHFDAGGNYFRIGFGRKDLPEALSRLERYVKYRFVDRLNDY